VGVLREVEAAIRDRIADLFPNIRVISLIDRDAADLPNSSQIVVSYSGSKSLQEQLEQSAVARTAQFEIFLEIYDLQSHKGIYLLLEQIEKSLRNFAPHPQSGNLSWLSDRRIRYLEGCWQHLILFEVILPLEEDNG